MIELDDELQEHYLVESIQHLAAIEADLMAVECGGTDAAARAHADRILRALHSIKGQAGVFDLLKVVELAHRMEYASALMAAGKLEPTPDRISVLLQSVDRLRELMRDPEAGNRADIAASMSALGRLWADDPGLTPGGAKTRKPGPVHALLVEDDFSGRLLLQTFLSRYGECHVAVNGREAVDAFHSAIERVVPYDLICMDIMMPEMDGREAVRQIRAMEESHGILSRDGAKIIMTTAVTDIKEVVRCFQELCDGYLVKPIDLTQLLGLLKSYELVA